MIYRVTDPARAMIILIYDGSKAVCDRRIKCRVTDPARAN
jgi:hypothetical protein